MYHEGSSLTSGLKYLMRSDLMFTRINRSIDEDKAESWVYLKQAEALEEQRRSMEAIPLYKTAFKLNPEIERYC